jgi:hypothetical protein
VGVLSQYMVNAEELDILGAQSAMPRPVLL